MLLDLKISLHFKNANLKMVQISKYFHIKKVQK
jgi:hypothetical protein